MWEGIICIFLGLAIGVPLTLLCLLGVDWMVIWYNQPKPRAMVTLGDIVHGLADGAVTSMGVLVIVGMIDGAISLGGWLYGRIVRAWRGDENQAAMESNKYLGHDAIGGSDVLWMNWRCEWRRGRARHTEKAKGLDHERLSDGSNAALLTWFLRI